MSYNENELINAEELLISTYGSRDFSSPVPKYKLPDKGVSSDHAYSLVNDMLMLDGNSRLNLATFVTTWMEPEAKKLMEQTFDKNMIDKDEYPQTAEIEVRCVRMIADLWHAPFEKEKVVAGCSTTGSSEAGMLAGMAMKWRWRERMEKKGKSISSPNLVMGSNVQVCWEKFCRYFEVEPRQVPIENGRYKMDPKEAIKLCDENTIGIIGILGTTFTGEYESIEEINSELDELNRKTLWNIPIHIDAASGGFFAPFIQPDLVWDFRLKWVKSINASGHKYGLVYPGVGWVIWRRKEELPKDLIFNVNYLGGQMPTFALNFSRPGSQIIAQYYNFLRLGKEGYRRIHQNCQDVAVYLSGKIEKMGPFELLTRGTDIPVFCWKLRECQHYSLFDLSERLRYNGWLIPAYTLPENLTGVVVMRIVVKEGFTIELANLLLKHMEAALEYFEKYSLDLKAVSGENKKRSSFHH